MIALCDQLGGAELTVVRQANAGIAEAVQLAAQAVLSRGSVGEMRPVDEVWAYATRGEREILHGDGRRARHEYRKAIGLTDCTLFMIETMLSQLKLYDLLGVHQDVLAPVLEDLEYQVAQRQLKLKRYETVVVFSGHRSDEPGRTPARFRNARAARWPRRSALDSRRGRSVRTSRCWRSAGERAAATSCSRKSAASWAPICGSWCLCRRGISSPNRCAAMPATGWNATSA